MNTVSVNSQKKKKLIELPVDVCKILAIQAAAMGISLKKHIENIIITKTESWKINTKENPSPSGDDWFNDPQNISMVMEGIEEYKLGETIPMSIEDIDKKLGL